MTCSTGCTYTTVSDNEGTALLRFIWEHMLATDVPCYRCTAIVQALHPTTKHAFRQHPQCVLNQLTVFYKRLLTSLTKLLVSRLQVGLHTCKYCASPVPAGNGMSQSDCCTTAGKDCWPQCMLKVNTEGSSAGSTATITTAASSFAESGCWPQCMLEVHTGGSPAGSKHDGIFSSSKPNC